MKNEFCRSRHGGRNGASLGCPPGGAPNTKSERVKRQKMKIRQVQSSEDSETISRLFKGRSREIVPWVMEIIDDLEEWHPLTVRQVYYQLVAKEIIGNSLSEYQNISRLLTRMRAEGLVPWSVITDRSRRMIDKRGTSNIEEHVRENMEYLFNGYNRCLVQNQENYVEVWTEKDALSSIFEEAVWKYCCRVVVCRGQVSATFLKEYAIRAEAARSQWRTPIILYFGDLDPSGLRIPDTIGRNLYVRHGLLVEVKRIALWPQDVELHDLPFNKTATKKKDPNYAWYCEQGYGNYSVELDALHPKDLLEMIDASLCSHLDVEDMLAQQDIQAKERRTLKKLKLGFHDLCHSHGLQI